MFSRALGPKTLRLSIPVRQTSFQAYASFSVVEGKEDCRISETGLRLTAMARARALSVGHAVSSEPLDQSRAAVVHLSGSRSSGYAEVIQSGPSIKLKTTPKPSWALTPRYLMPSDFGLRF